MGEENQPGQNTPAPAVILARNTGAQIGLALVVTGLILATIGILSDAWLVQPSSDIEVGLFDTSVGDETINHGETYIECSTNFKELDFNKSVIEETCGPLKSLHDAGFVGSILIWSGVATLLVAMVFQIKSFTGYRNKLTSITSLLGGGLVGIGVITWYLMLPESTDNPDLGYALWFCIISASFAVIAGFTNTIQSLLDGPPRMRANGVRYDEEMAEFVLKESSCGDKTLSILCDDQLIRVVRIERKGALPEVSDLLATRRDAYTGFSHQRIDWLDEMRGIWWVLAGVGLMSTFAINPLFSILFIIGFSLALAQLMDPERFVISTNSGNHSFMINRWRSNRELTNLSMDLVDEAMIAVLRGGDLDTDKIDNRAQLIAERFRFETEQKQKELTQESKPKPVVEPVPAPVPISVPVPVPESPNQQPSAPVQAPSSQAPEQPPSTPVVLPPPPPLPASSPPKVATIPAPPTMAPPMITPPPAALPPPPPTMAPPTTAPPTTAPPMITPPPAALPPPPPTTAPPMITPPPAALPPPPPTMAHPMMTPTPAVLPPPPPMVVQASPREENLSTDEKDGLLGDLID